VAEKNSGTGSVEHHRLSTRVHRGDQVNIAEHPIVQYLGIYAPAWFRSSLASTQRQDTIIWDSGASMSISHDRKDFVGPIHVPKGNGGLLGISTKAVKIEGHGHVAWAMEDVNGMLRSIKVPCLLVPSVRQRLLSTTSLLQAYPSESITLTQSIMKLSGSQDGNVGAIEAKVDPRNNLPTSIMHNLAEANQVAKNLANLATTVSDANRNLSDPEKGEGTPKMASTSCAY
jgi:hypothetical protein